jgi:outer membrane receptor protein involved in Fe transport
MVNIPLTDQLALRVSGLRSVVPGYIDSRFGKDYDQEDTTAVRAMLGWKITDSLELSLLAMRQDHASRRPHQLQPGGSGPAEQPDTGWRPAAYQVLHQRSRPLHSATNESDMYSGKLVYGKDWGTITASASYLRAVMPVTDRDASAAAEVLSGGALHADSTGISLIGGRGTAGPRSWIRSYELRYSSDWDGPVQILVGAFNQNEERRDGSYWQTVDHTTGLPGPNETVFCSRTSLVQLDQVALFGRGDLEHQRPAPQRPPACAGSTTTTIQDASRLVDFQSRPGPGPGQTFKFGESGTTGRFNVSYDINDDVLTYLQIAEGFRAGGPNDQTAASIANVTIPAGFGLGTPSSITSWVSRRNGSSAGSR